MSPASLAALDGRPITFTPPSTQTPTVGDKGPMCATVGAGSKLAVLGVCQVTANLCQSGLPDERATARYG